MKCVSDYDGYVNHGEGDIDLLNLYLKEIGSFKILNEREEIKLGEEIFKGSKDAKDKLVNANYRLVVKIAKNYKNVNLDFMDLIQVGNIGLMKAAERFDYRQGYRFSTYATWWIKQAITRDIADHGRVIRIPVHMIESINKAKRIIREYNTYLGKEPSIEDLQEELEWQRDKVLLVLKLLRDPVSIDMVIGDDGDSSLIDFIPADEEETVEDKVIYSFCREEIIKILNTLNERERRVIELRFGLLDGRERTLELVGKEFNVTRERIRQIEAKALRKLRHPSRSKNLKNYLIG